MALENIDLDAITEADLIALIGTGERRAVDFKRDSYDRANKGRFEFAADVVSFANTVGGHIIIGMDEVDGVATALVGITGDADAERRRLEQIANERVRRQITGLRIVTVQLANGNSAIVVRVPRSWDKPHGMLPPGHTYLRFFARTEGGKYEPDLDQLRELFAVAPALAERIRDWRFERLAAIRAGDTPRPADGRSLVILHMIPFGAFESRPIAVGDLYRDPMGLHPLGSGGISWRVNIDGMVVFRGDRNAPTPSYVQVWRDGRIEAVAAVGAVEHQGVLHYPDQFVEQELVSSVGNYADRLVKLGVEMPMAVFVSLVGVRGALYSRGWRSDGEVFDRDDIHTSEVVLHTMPSRTADIAQALRPIFDDLANGAGWDASPNFDAAGAWKPKG